MDPEQIKNIEVEVSPDAEEFYLAFSKGWTKFSGHSIETNGLKFSAVPIKDKIRVSEVESGAKFFDIPVPEEVDSFEETMFFLEIMVAPQIVMLIETIGLNKVKQEIGRMRQTAISKYGEKPTGQKINTEWIRDDLSDVLH